MFVGEDSWGIRVNHSETQGGQESTGGYLGGKHFCNVLSRLDINGS